MNQCLFCQIAEGKIKSDVIYRNDEVVVFKDIHPKKPIHWLVIPKEHIASINELEAGDTMLMGQMILAIKKLAIEHGFADNGYRVVINTNTHGGQEVDHLHIHILAGEPAGPMVSK